MVIMKQLKFLRRIKQSNHKTIWNVKRGKQFGDEPKPITTCLMRIYQRVLCFSSLDLRCMFSHACRVPIAHLSAPLNFG